MALHSVVRIVALAIAPAIFTATIDRDPNRRTLVHRVEPAIATPAEIVTAYGTGLDRLNVVDLILANNHRTAITHIFEQRPQFIRFRVPPSLDPGEYRIVLVVESRWGTELADQDVVLMVVSEQAFNSRSMYALAGPSEPRSKPPQYR